MTHSRITIRHKRCLSVVALVAAALVTMTAAGAQETAQGYVFNDKNANGLRDPGEKGVEGVCVSNGRDVVKTDGSGAYALAVDDDTAIFVIKPSGWTLPLSELNIPRFYYMHKPGGSVPSKYPGLEPTGEVPVSIDFALQKVNEPKRFTALFLGDSQARNQTETDYLVHDVMEELVGTDARFGSILGDVAFDDLDVLEPVMAAASLVDIPWYHVAGNHDTNQDAPDDVDSMETWKRLLGPPYYAFNVGPVHFIVLEDVDWHGDGYNCALGEEQLAFVRNDLAHVAKDRLVVLLMHIPIMGIREKKELFEVLSEYPHTFSMSAHWHSHENHLLGAEQGWPGEEPHHHVVLGTACGSWWEGTLDEYGIPHAMMADGTPNGYSICEFDGTDYTLTYKAARFPADFKMSIHAPDVVARAEAADAKVHVNVFNGSERSTVEMRLGDEGKWTPLEKAAVPDPYFLRLKEFEKTLPKSAGRELPKPDDVTHMWAGTLPANPPVGIHLIHVRTTDMYGRTFTDVRGIRVE